MPTPEEVAKDKMQPLADAYRVALLAVTPRDTHPIVALMAIGLAINLILLNYCRTGHAAAVKDFLETIISTMPPEARPSREN